ncbi:AAA family ATPase [Xylaria cf. heliscus]|nr:AAA family ATPase [Xylaria cf. heliscus]
MNGEAVREQWRNYSVDEDFALREELKRLRCENEKMRKWQGEHEMPAQPAEPAFTYRTFYRIGSAHYLDEPDWELCDGTPVLRSQNPIHNFHDYLHQRPDIAFAIIKTYDPYPPQDHSRIEISDGVYRIPEPTSQFLLFISDAMIDAIEDFVELVPQFGELFPLFNPQREIPAPYLFMFHSAPYLPEILPELGAVSRYLLIQLDKCIKESHGPEHESAQALAKKGLVSNNSFGYLIRPGDVLVDRAGPRTRAYIALEWAQEGKASQGERKADFRYNKWNTQKKAPRKGQDADKQEGFLIWHMWTVEVWSWAFNGEFGFHRQRLDVGVKAGYSAEIVPIDQLEIIPLRYATSNIRDQLERRGRMFWTLRYRRYINYQQNRDGEWSNMADRYMVDMETYKKLHPKSAASKMELLSSLSDEEMKSDEPPSGDCLLLFPPQIVGFNLLRKSWMDLYVDYISPVTWNKQAFEDLAVDAETKELVMALVMKQLASEQTSDFIVGKGNGLILLLHGGPGTGKTFTAEGVAEFVEKPLLRVTCGDIGTAAEVVEKRLQSTFHLGKIWDCVVLLDEADVFLEERDMKDLNRNALVSVFLRELEYHDGILLLTSNRVGTFDEAFKSRIQLSLHYENLGVSQRRKIWRNFINRVKSLDPTIDYEDIVDHIDDLSGVDMDGREIRNAMTTARQLAEFRQKPLNYGHLSHVLRVNRKFSKYLDDLRDGLTADDIKRDSGLRLTYQTSKKGNKESPF